MESPAPFSKTEEVTCHHAPFRHATFPHSTSSSLDEERLQFVPLVLGRGRTLRVAQIGQESGIVEFRMYQVDLHHIGLDIEDVNASDWVSVVSSTTGRLPAPADLVAAVENVKVFEVEWWLRA